MLKVVPTPEVSKSKGYISLSFVVDTSGSMRDTFQGIQKLEKAIEASHRLVDNRHLTERDKISIIQFDSESTVLLPLTNLDDKGKRLAHEKIDELKKYSGGTYMAKGLKNAYNVLSAEPPETSKRIILLTDGMTFDEEECIAITRQLAKLNVPIISLGIGEEYNQELLIQISDMTKGEHYHLYDLSILDRLFQENLEKALKEVVTDLKLVVQTVKGVELTRVTRVYPSMAEIPIEGKEIKLGNVQKGDFTIYILTFDIKGIKRPPSRARIAKLNLWASAPALGLKDVEFPPIELYVNFTTDTNLLRIVNQEVLDYVKQRNIDSIITEATKIVSHNPQKATQLLNQAKTIAQSTGNTLLVQNIENALKELQSSGTISVNTTRTLRSNTRTRTVKSQYTKPMDLGLSDEDIRNLTGA
jgi:Ca-activated chloride channel family protein